MSSVSTAIDSRGPRALTGIPGLDVVLNGGLPRSRMYLVEGDPGAGKTTLALQFLLEGAREGEPGIYVTLSETKEELLAVAESHGWSLEPLTICELITPEERLRPEAQYTLFHPSEVELGETTKLVLDEVERRRPSRVVFDSLSEMQLLARDPLRFRRQILALKQFFVGRACTVLFLDDKSSDTDHARVDSLVHGVISLEHFAPVYGAERRRLRIAKLRGVRYCGGYHDFDIKTGGIAVYPRLLVAHHRETFAPDTLSSGSEELDALLGGGLDAGTSTLVIGPAGVGKSVLASRFALAALERGERAAIYIFDETRRTFLQRSAGLGMRFDGRFNGAFSLTQIDPAELPPGAFVDQVRGAVADGARLIVIDSLNGYLNAMPEEQFLTVQLHELLTYLNQHGVIALLVAAQHGLLGRMETPVDVSYLADTVVMLRFFEAAGEVRQALSVVKKRSGWHERTIRELTIGRGGVRVGEPLRDFEGVLTGVPRYTGNRLPLLGAHGDDGGGA